LKKTQTVIAVVGIVLVGALAWWWQQRASADTAKAVTGAAGAPAP
jgi:hypothetical protein